MSTKDKFVELMQLEKERDEYIYQYDYWFGLMHEFWLKNKIVYIEFRHSVDCEPEGNPYEQTYFQWSDYPGMWEQFDYNMEYYRKEANKVRSKIKEIELGLSDYELSLLVYGWEDKFVENYEKYLK